MSKNFKILSTVVDEYTINIKAKVKGDNPDIEESFAGLDVKVAGEIVFQWDYAKDGSKVSFDDDISDKIDEEGVFLIEVETVLVNSQGTEKVKNEVEISIKRSGRKIFELEYVTGTNSVRFVEDTIGVLA